MSYPYYRDLWPQVKQHAWKYALRTQDIDAIIWHATRGSQGYPGTTELNAYCNWAVSPNNVRPSGYAGIANVGIGPQGVVLCVPLELRPTHSSWPSDEHAISVEVAQSNLGQAIEPATIEHCARFAEYVRAEYGIPKIRVTPTNDRTWKGETGHAMTVQGRAQGKSDPDQAFWTPYLATWEEDEAMTPAERAEMDAMKTEITVLRADLEKLNTAEVQRWSLLEIAGGPIEGVRDAIKDLETP